MNFKSLIATVAVATALVATGCQKYDDTEITNRVEVLEGKVTTIEDAIKSINDAISNKYAVESVAKTDEGWTINFTNGKSIDLVNGKDGDSFLTSVEEDGEFVYITLNDEKKSLFTLPKDIKIVLGDAESSYILIDDENNEIALTIPEISNVAAVSGTVYSATGNTTDVVTKANASGWSVKIANDFSKATVIAEDAPKGSRALFVLTVTKVDGTTITSSKPLIYFMTDDTAYEEFAAEFEGLQKQWTMVNNATVNSEEYEDEKYDEIKDAAAQALSAVAQNMNTKQTWADESYNNGTLAADLDEILASFEEIQIQLTQVLNTFNDGLKAIANDEAYELFAQEYENLQKSWTMAYNSTFGNEDYEDLDLSELEDELLPMLSGISQMIDEKGKWAEESYNDGTLADDLDEILASFEDVQKALTTFLNRFNDAIANDKAFIEFDQQYRSLQQQYTQIMNVTLNNEENDGYYTEEEEEDFLAILSGIYQQMETFQTWATESYAAGTLAAELDEILASFEDVQKALTQYKNLFDDTVNPRKQKANDDAYEEFTFAIESLEQQWTMVYNTVKDNEDAVAELNAVYNKINALKTKIEESYEAGTLVADMDKLYSEFEPIQIDLTKILNKYSAE